MTETEQKTAGNSLISKLQQVFEGQISLDQEIDEDDESPTAKVTQKAASRIIGALVHLAQLKKQKICIDQTIEILLTPPNMRTDEQTARLITLLQESPIFDGLSGETMGQLSDRMKIIHAPANRVICRQGEIGMNFYILLRGSLDVLRDNKLMNTLTQERSVFGEIALDSENTILRTASVITTTESWIAFCKKRDYKLYLSKQQTNINTQKTLFLRKFPICENIPQNKLTRIFYLMFENTVTKGGYLFKQNEKTDFIHFISKGSVLYMREFT